MESLSVGPQVREYILLKFFKNEMKTVIYYIPKIRRKISLVIYNPLHAKWYYHRKIRNFIAILKISKWLAGFAKINEINLRVVSYFLRLVSIGLSASAV